MKNIIILIALMSITVSCLSHEDRTNQNNPAEVDIPGKAFTVTVCDRQPGVNADSTYFFYGVLTKNADDGIVNFTEGTCTGSDYRFTYTPDPVKLIQTGYNEISFETSEDVNASSSDKAIDIVKIDARHFRLVCHQITGSQNSIDEGTARIRFWNGSGSGEKSISINVDARSSVRIEGFEFRLDGEQFFLKEVSSSQFQNLRYNKITDWEPYTFKQIRFAGKEHHEYYGSDIVKQIEDEFDVTKGYRFEFVGTVPRNATPDNNVKRLVDCFSMRTNGNAMFWDEKACFYLWNEAGRYPGYRGLPFDNHAASDVMGKIAETRFYPADLRYRKAWIWNRTFFSMQHETFKTYQHYCYLCYDGNTERVFVGCIREK